jgi:hypothetical protein
MATFMRIGNGRYNLDHLAYWVPNYDGVELRSVTFALRGVQQPFTIEGELAKDAVAALSAISDPTKPPRPVRISDLVKKKPKRGK